MKDSAIAPFSQPDVKVPPAIASGAKIAEIPALVPCQIRVEKVTVCGVSQTPQLIYKTAKGRCSTLLSKSQFLECWRCWLEIKQIKFGKIISFETQDSGIILKTANGNFFIETHEAVAFLSRYNRVALEKLYVKLNAQGAVVWNPISHNISIIDENGCNCPDHLYRQTVCKHQIAMQVCQFI